MSLSWQHRERKGIAIQSIENEKSDSGALAWTNQISRKILCEFITEKTRIQYTGRQQ